MEQGEIILYQPENSIHLEVKMERDTVWLTQEQISELFQRERSVITKHISKVFSEGELDAKSNVQNLHIAFSDRPVKYYSLDVIISVGYRVKSQRGVQFRIWATSILKDYLLKGYAINRRIEKLEQCIEEMFGDQNDINEDTRMQLESISLTLAELQSKKKEEKPRRPIGYDTPKEGLTSI